MRPITTFERPLSRFLLALAVAGLSLAAGAATPRSDIVGEIITVIGEGRVLDAGGGTQGAVRGLRLRSGDRIETAAGGHVHLRFIDGGLVSVRPASRLTVESYRNADSLGPAAIKFRLEEGVMRSVTGQWGEAHRDRFRLNTPIAAIGIKGTDFIVKADGARSTYASVASGAIVMAPLEGDCAATLGPCQGERAVLLSAEMQGKMLEFLRGNGAAPRLVPAADLLAAAQGQSGLAAPRRLESIASADAAEKSSLRDSQANAALPEAIPSAGKPLVWLHNKAGWNVPQNTLSERFTEARAAGMRAAVGNFFINLYRDESILSTFQPVGASASFNLTGASATYAQPLPYGRPVENVQVSNAVLNVDFARAAFTTQLDLSSPSLGQDRFAASGGITREGLFVSNTTNQNLAGAFSMDGRQAGYNFDKTLTGGRISGLTLWGR
jgi:hypothetical protein